MEQPVQPRKINQNWLAQQRNKLAVTAPNSPAYARIRAEIEKAEAEHAAWQEQQKQRQVASPAGVEEAAEPVTPEKNPGAVPNPILDHVIQDVFGGMLWMTEDPEKFASRFDVVTLKKLSPAQRKTVADVVFNSRATTPRGRDCVRAIFAVLAKKYPEFVLADESGQ